MTHTTQRAPLREAPSSAPPSPRPLQRPPGMSLVEAMIAAGLLAAVTLTTLVIASDSDPQRFGPEQVPIGTSRPGVPLSADGAERYFADHSMSRPGVPLSADGAERHFSGTSRPLGVPGSADAAERYLAGQD